MRFLPVGGLLHLLKEAENYICQYSVDFMVLKNYYHTCKKIFVRYVIGSVDFMANNTQKHMQ